MKDILYFEKLPNKKMTFIVSLLAALVSVIMIIVFFTLKKGYFCDEIYSYSTANSSGSMSPLIDFDNTLHIDKWYTADELLQSVYVSKEELFNYRHINEQLAEDAHPPLYFYMLHFLSSFTPGQFSWIPSVIINAFSVFFMLIFFYRLVFLLSGSRFKSLLSMIFFSGTSAMISLMTFSRNYTMMTAFIVIFTWFLFNSMKLHNAGEKYRRDLAFASFFLFLTIYTQYIALVFIFILVFLSFIYYLIKKDIVFSLQLVLFSLLPAGLFIIVFPEIFAQLSIDQTAVDNAAAYPYALELRTTLHILFSEVFGINTPMRPTMIFFWIFWTFIALVMLVILIRFLFRNDNWYKNISKKITGHFHDILPHIKSLAFYQYLFILLSVIFSVFIISKLFKIYYYYPSSDRYLFLLFPFCAILVLLPLMMLVRKDFLQIILVVILMICSLTFGNKFYLYEKSMPVQEVSEALSDSDVLLYGTNHLAIVSTLLHVKDSNRVYVTTSSSFDKIKFTGELSDDAPLFMIYEWPSFSLLDEQQNFTNTLKAFEESKITTLGSGDREYYNSKIVGSFSNFIVVRLR